MCAPPDWAERLAEFGVPLVPIGPSVRELVHGATPPSAADVPRRAAELIAEQFDKLPAAAEGCDALVATGLFPVAASAQSVAEKLGIRYVFAAYCPIYLPSPHHRPQPLPGRPLPPDVTDNRVLNELEHPELQRGVRRRAQHPPGVDRPAAGGQRPRPRHHRPPVAGGGPGPGPVAGAGGPRRRADRRVDRAGRTPAAGRAGGVPGRRPAAGVRGLRQHARPGGRRPGGHRRDPRAGPPRARRPRLGRPRPDRRRGTTASPSARSTSRHCSAGWPPSCTTAARAPRRPPPGPARLRWWCPRWRTSRTSPAGWPTWASARPTTVRLRPPSPCRPRSSTALAPETRARATAVAGTIRTDGATVAATLLVDTISRTARS